MKKSCFLKSCCLQVTAIFLFTTACSALAGDFTLFSVPDAEVTYPHAINGAGTVAGSYQKGQEQGVFVGKPGGDIETYAFVDGLAQITAINSAGTVVGYVDNNGYKGLIIHPDKSLELLSIGGNDSVLMDANASGTMIGYYLAASGDRVISFIAKPNGKITEFSLEDWPIAAPDAINNKGTIAGVAYDPSNGAGLGFIRHVSGEIEMFDIPNTPADKQMRVMDINEAGTVLGLFIYYDPDKGEVFDGFERTQRGVITVHNVADSSGSRTITYPQAINAAGTVLGFSGNNRVPYIKDRHGNISFLTHPDGSSVIIATDINASGAITGMLLDAKRGVGYIYH